MGTENSIDIDKLAKLSRLVLSDSEAACAVEQLQDMLKLMENLKALDLSGVEPMVSNEKSALREDSAVQGLGYGQVFFNAPKEENHHFAIPKVI